MHASPSGKWLLDGALCGYLSSYVFFTIHLFWSAWPAEGVGFGDMWFIVLSGLIYGLIIYHVTGLFVISAVAGLAWGLVCAWLERSLEIKRRRALILAILILTAPVAEIAMLLPPRWFGQAPVVF